MLTEHMKVLKNILKNELSQNNNKESHNECVMKRCKSDGKVKHHRVFLWCFD